MTADVLITGNLVEKCTNYTWVKAFKFYNRHHNPIDDKIMKNYPKVMMFVFEQNTSYLRRHMENTQDSVWEKKPAQDSWFKTTVPFESSFKYWFALMWQNGYIALFLIAGAFLAGMLYDLTGYQKFWAFVPGLAMIAISYLGFWQYYEDMKKDTSQ